MNQSLKLVWDGSLDTGHRAIDIQHKYLVDIINELAEAIEEGKGAEKVKAILHLLQYYTEWHFGREEKCMDENRCPFAEANQQAHRQFIDSLTAFREEYAQSGGSDDIALRMYRTLTEWLVVHIKKIDVRNIESIQSDETEAATGD